MDPAAHPLAIGHGCDSMVGAQMIVRGWPVPSGPREQTVWNWTSVGKNDRTRDGGRSAPRGRRLGVRGR
jgi:hypothetical protein